MKLLNQQNRVFIDPGNCRSSVGYYIHIDEYSPKDKPTLHSITASVVLADCSHSIGWIFGAGNLEKIDAAIHMLQEFRKKYIETEKLVAKLNKEAL